MRITAHVSSSFYLEPVPWHVRVRVHYMVVWVYTREVNAKRLLEAYLRAFLRRNVEHFDNVGGGEVATHIPTDTCRCIIPFTSLTSTDPRI